MRKIDPHGTFTDLWLFILLTVIFKDMHQRVMPGSTGHIMTGVFHGAPLATMPSHPADRDNTMATQRGAQWP